MRRRNEDSGSKVPLILILMPLVAVVGLVVFQIVTDLTRPRISRRYTVAAVGNPYLVMSFDMTDRSVVLIPVPPGTHIQAAHGYGLYGLGALRELDAMEHRGGDLIISSLTDAIGFPVDGYIDTSTVAKIMSQDSIEDFRKIMQTGNIVTAMLAKRTDVPPVMLARLWSMSGAMADTSIRVVDMRRGNLLTDTVLPDGSTVQTVNEERLDSAMGTLLEDPDVRSEHVRVAVYNTTGISGLAQRQARILDTAGMFVVAVDSRDTAIPGCRITVRADVADSRTVRLVREYFGCPKAETGEDDRADVSVYLGNGAAARYLPYP